MVSLWGSSSKSIRGMVRQVEQPHIQESLSESIRSSLQRILAALCTRTFLFASSSSVCSFLYNFFFFISMSSLAFHSYNWKPYSEQKLWTEKSMIMKRQSKKWKPKKISFKIFLFYNTKPLSFDKLTKISDFIVFS